MRIGEAARHAGVSASAIRYYERRGVLPPARRVSGIRRYDDADVDRLRLITYYRSCGVSVRTLQSIFTAGDDRRYAKAHAEIDRRIAELDDVMRAARAMQRRLRSLQQCNCRGDRRRCVVYARG